MRKFKFNTFSALIIFSVSIVALLMVIAYVYKNDNRNETSVASEEVQDVDLFANSKKALTDKISTELEQASSPIEKLHALLSATTLALDNGDSDKAQEYAIEAYSIDGLDPAGRFQKSMNLVAVYGGTSQFGKGIETLDELENDTDAMALEASKFYVNRYRSAFLKNEMPAPLNCQEPQTPEDCPIQ